MSKPMDEPDDPRPTPPPRPLSAAILAALHASPALKHSVADITVEVHRRLPDWDPEPEFQGNAATAVKHELAMLLASDKIAGHPEYVPTHFSVTDYDE